MGIIIRTRDVVPVVLRLYSVGVESLDSRTMEELSVYVQTILALVEREARSRVDMTSDSTNNYVTNRNDAKS